jgi:mannose-6-phosphate isomerase-like protein (cupin superfamily)
MKSKPYLAVAATILTFIAIKALAASGQHEEFLYLTDKVAADQLPSTRHGFGGKYLSQGDVFKAQLAVRDESGQVEQHADWNDYMIVQEGTATLTYGGTTVDAKEVAPGETRGSSIAGGQTIQMRPGDVIIIPAGMPHLMALKSGDRFRYLVFKTKTKT